MSDISLPKDARKMLAAMENSQIQVVQAGKKAASVLLEFGLADSITVPHDDRIDGKPGITDWQLDITPKGREWLQSYADKRAARRHDFCIAFISALLGWLLPKLVAFIWDYMAPLLQRAGA